MPCLRFISPFSSICTSSSSSTFTGSDGREGSGSTGYTLGNGAEKVSTTGLVGGETSFCLTATFSRLFSSDCLGFSTLGKGCDGSRTPLEEGGLTG